MHSKDLTWRYSLAVTLLLLSPFDLIASLGMDMYLPVIPSMAQALNASASTIQLTLTVYLVVLGAGQLIVGPLSDHFGRRPVLLLGGMTYFLASVGLALASSPAAFLALRTLQAAGASACLVAVFATVRDVYAKRPEGSVIYGLLGSMLAMVPALGPLLGTSVAAWLGWRAIFLVLAVAMLGAVVSAWLLWPETRRARTGSLSWRQLFVPLKSFGFWLYTLGYSAGMGSFFVFFSVAPWVMMGRQQLSAFEFSLVFGTVAIVMMIAAQVIGRLVRRVGEIVILRAGMGCLIAGALLLVAGESLIQESVMGFIGPMWLIGVGISAAVSVGPNGALRGLDHIAGTATAVYFCLGGVLLGGIGTLIILLTPGGSAWPIAAYCMLMAAITLGLSLHRRPGLIGGRS
ncbi:CmlA/FloR family chloramphenicol efflux MFS transporter [Pseudomonas sp. REST10]|uniref:CmlA/FloR family chloramphenicol efflux MFS transporter n=1 Tax=Pseudomonas sp. REST10 TaxID=2512235 RepID=UPI00240E77CE|nr:CmlA/FloR family chloramphenicol efflux MFS transporter [Pseudomonas sp. REST10]WFC61459.1 CmlA/FloR family chloramphenicol efflux MFS transporter [Pseudomonas sp. REST10]